MGFYPGEFFGGGRSKPLSTSSSIPATVDACGDGTTEFVRFFVEDASGRHDLGLGSVQVYNIPGPLPLSYAVSVNFNQPRKFCSTENILNVRAISRGVEPTAGDPDFTPVYGNVLNARVQVQKRFFIDIPLKELVAEKILTSNRRSSRTWTWTSRCRPKNRKS